MAFGSELPARASFSQSVSIKNRFVKRFTAPGCFCIYLERDSSSFVVKLKYIRGRGEWRIQIRHLFPVRSFLLRKLRARISAEIHETEYRVYETTGHSIDDGSRKIIGSRIEGIDKRKLHGLNGCSRALREIFEFKEEFNLFFRFNNSERSLKIEDFFFSKINTLIGFYRIWNNRYLLVQSMGDWYCRFEFSNVTCCRKK